MKHQVLDHRREDTDVDLLADYAALHKGGKAFMERIDRFLPQRPAEPNEVYAFRKKSAHYLNYAGPIVNFFAALTFSDEPEVTSEPVADEWYTAFRDNCDGLGTDLIDVLHERIRKALVEKAAWILVDFPSDAGAQPTDRKDWEERGLGDAYVCAFDEADVRDWCADDRGELEWAIIKQRDTRRRNPFELNDTVTDTWTVWTREEWVRYAITYKKGETPKPDDEIPEVGRGKVATPGRVPLVRIELDDALWAMDILASPQIEQARSRNALSWGLARSCFAQRIWKLHEPPGEDPPPQGAGNGQVIGIDESVMWDAPPADAFTPIAEYAKGLKDELYRVAHQMAMGVENNAAAVGRSAESKEADADATTVVVHALAKVVRETLKRVLDLVALGRDDGDLEWKIGGMDTYGAVDAKTLTDAAIAADTLAIPSATWRRLLLRRVALAQVPDATPEEREKIVKEIEAGVTDESVVVQPKVDPNAEEPDGDEGKPGPGDQDGDEGEQQQAAAE